MNWLGVQKVLNKRKQTLEGLCRMIIANLPGLVRVWSITMVHIIAFVLFFQGNNSVVQLYFFAHLPIEASWTWKLVALNKIPLPSDNDGHWGT